jgi:hypothetical protein
VSGGGAHPPGDEENRDRPRGREVDGRQELDGECRKEGPVPSEERDHRGAHHDVEGGVEARERAAREERHEPELNGVGNDGDDPRRENAPLPVFHPATLGPAAGIGQPRSLTARRLPMLAHAVAVARLQLPEHDRRNDGHRAEDEEGAVNAVEHLAGV